MDGNLNQPAGPCCRSAVALQFPAQDTNSLREVGHAQALAIGRALGSGVDVKTLAVIFDPQNHPGSLPTEVDPRLGCGRVFDDVIEKLLDDSVNVDFRTSGQ